MGLPVSVEGYVDNLQELLDTDLPGLCCFLGLILIEQGQPVCFLVLGRISWLGHVAWLLPAVVVCRAGQLCVSDYRANLDCLAD